MAISVVGTSSNTSTGTAAPVILNLPSSVVAGNLLVAIAIAYSNTVPDTGTWSPPSGWTLLTNFPITQGTITPIYGIFTKIAGASEPSTYSFGITFGTGPAFAFQAGNIYALSGAQGVDGTRWSQNSGAGTAGTATGVTVPSGDATITIFSDPYSTAVWTTPSGFSTESGWDVNSTSAAPNAYFSTTYASGNVTNGTPANPWAAFLIGFAPIVAGFRHPQLAQSKRKLRHEFIQAQHSVRIYHPKPAQFETLLVPIKPRPVLSRMHSHWSVGVMRWRLFTRRSRRIGQIIGAQVVDAIVVWRHRAGMQ